METGVQHIARHNAVYCKDENAVYCKDEVIKCFNRTVATTNTKAAEQIRRVFDDNSRIIGPGHAKMCLMPYANNKGADQPAHPRSLISTFVVHCLESMICILALSQVSRF